MSGRSFPRFSLASDQVEHDRRRGASQSEQVDSTTDADGAATALSSRSS
jgi:hypothetical protein